MASIFDLGFHQIVLGLMITLCFFVFPDLVLVHWLLIQVLDMADDTCKVGTVPLLTQACLPPWVQAFPSVSMYGCLLHALRNLFKE